MTGIALTFLIERIKFEQDTSSKAKILKYQNLSFFGTCIVPKNLNQFCVCTLLISGFLNQIIVKCF